MKDRFPKRALAILLMACLLVSPISSLAAAKKTLTVSVAAVTYQNRAREALKSINRFRKQYGLKELAELADLEKAALQRAAEIFVLYDHVRPDLTDYNTCLDSYESLTGYTFAMEAIAAGEDFSKASEVEAEWEENAADALLDEDMTHAGIACINVEGSKNGYYWCLLLTAYPEGTQAKSGNSGSKAGAEKTIPVVISSGMYEKADNTHRKFDLRADNLTLKTKTTAKPTVYLYDKYDVKIGKCELTDLSFTSSNKSVFTVDVDGTVTRKKTGSAILTIKSTGLENAECTVTCGSGSPSVTSGSSSSSASSTVPIKSRQPEITVKEYKNYTSLNASLSGVDGFVLYRSNTKTGEYKKIDEAEASRSHTFKIMYDEMDRSYYYYEVRAYTVSGGKRTYSAYSDPVRVDK